MPPLERGDVIVAFGDSLTRGTGAAEGEGYPEVLAQLTGFEVVNAGIPGEQSARGLARLEGVLDEYEPKVLLLCHGGNDMLARIGHAQTAANLRAMVEMAKSRGIQVVLIGVPEPALLGGTADFYGELADELGIACEDRVVNRVLRNSSLKSDPIHPNADGYRKIAEAVAELLRKAGAI